MDTFSALSDSNRRKIIELLSKHGELASTEISDRFEISAPAISQHLKVLREANLVIVEKRAQQRIYRINPDAMLELEVWARQIRHLWDQRFNALDEILQEEKQKENNREQE